MTKPKYRVGDRLLIMNRVEIEIIRVIEAPEPVYIFQIVNAPSLQSAVTETKLEKAITT